MIYYNYYYYIYISLIFLQYFQSNIFYIYILYIYIFMILLNILFCTAALTNEIKLENFNNVLLIFIFDQIVFFLPAEIYKKIRFIIDTGSSRTVIPLNFI